MVFEKSAMIISSIEGVLNFRGCVIDKHSKQVVWLLIVFDLFSSRELPVPY